MRQFIAAWVVFAITCAAFAVQPASAEPNSESSCCISGTRVNLRATPGGTVLRELNDGAPLEVLQREGEWVQVALPSGEKGWVFATFVTTPQVNETVGAGNNEQVAEVALSDFTEVRAGQTTSQSQPPVQAKSKTVPAKQEKQTKTVQAVTFKDVKLTSPAKLGSADYRSVAGPELASISAENVNLRESASLTAKVVGKVTAGDRAYVVTNSDPWYLVSIPEKQLKGWVFGEYVDVQPRIEIKADDVRLRETPGLDGRIKDQLKRGDVFYKVQAKDGWVQVASSASGLSGWVKAEYTVKSTGSVSRPYTITGDQVNFRASPNIDGDVIAKLPAGCQVNVLGRSEKWAYAYYQGHKGWLYTEYLSGGGKSDGSGSAQQARSSSMQASRTLTWKQVGGTPIGNRLIERARAMMGTPYVWGGESDDGVDCSGLIYKLLGDEGAQAKCLPRRASEQMQQLGLAVEKEELAPGDLVFFTTYKAGPSHVGIYLGDGDFIHASSAQRKVTVSNLSEGYYKKRFVGARRITEEELKTLQ